MKEVLEKQPKISLDDFRKEAEKLGFTVRVTNINNNPRYVSMDHRPTRVNVHVEGAEEYEREEIFDNGDSVKLKEFKLTPETFVVKIKSIG